MTDSGGHPTRATGPVNEYDAAERDALRARLGSFFAQRALPTRELEAAVEDALRSTDDESALFSRLSGAFPTSCASGQSNNGAAASPPTAQAFGTHTGGSGPVRLYEGALRERLWARLFAFYTRFNPTEMEKAERALGMKVDEQTLFSKLYEMYPEAVRLAAQPQQQQQARSSTHTTTGSSSSQFDAALPRRAPGCTDFWTATGGTGPVHQYTGALRGALHDRVTAFYRRFNPTELDKVDKAMQMKADEHTLFSKLYELYPGADRAALEELRHSSCRVPPTNPILRAFRGARAVPCQ